jgi:hypothetical protein
LTLFIDFIARKQIDGRIFSSTGRLISKAGNDLLQIKRLAAIRRGAWKHATDGPDPLKEKPENDFVFGASKSKRTGPDVGQALPSSIQTITVGSGIAPDHASNAATALAVYGDQNRRYKMKLVGFTTDREFTCTALRFMQCRCHPAPKVII